MLRSSYSIILLFIALNCVFCKIYSNDGYVSPVFSSLRRTDHSAATYHFSRISDYEPVNDPVIYADGYNDNTKMIVGFNNMLVFAYFENEKHYVIRVSEDLDEDMGSYATQSSNDNDSGELFDVVTLKPTTTTTQLPRLGESSIPWDPSTQSLTDYMQQLTFNASRA